MFIEVSNIFEIHQQTRDGVDRISQFCEGGVNCSHGAPKSL
jgi:hypothetical protein